MNFIDLGRLDYKEAYDIQTALVTRRIEGRIQDTVILLEHNPVVTIGRLGHSDSVINRKELEKSHINVEFVDRGGRATYHAPGQLVVYPIIDLKLYKRDIHYYLSMLEDFAEGFLRRYGVASDHVEAKRGVWVNGKKIASIGIAIKKWVTYHGVSININLDLSPFNFIEVCDEKKAALTSLACEIQNRFNIKKVKRDAEYEFRNAFGKAYSHTAKIPEMAY